MSKMINLKVSTGIKVVERTGHRKMVWSSKAISREELAKLIWVACTSPNPHDGWGYKPQSLYHEGKVYCWCYNGQ